MMRTADVRAFERIEDVLVDELERLILLHRRRFHPDGRLVTGIGVRREWWWYPDLRRWKSCEPEWRVRTIREDGPRSYPRWGRIRTASAISDLAPYVEAEHPGWLAAPVPQGFDYLAPDILPRGVAS